MNGVPDAPDAAREAAIRDHVADTLALARNPGLHFPGFFLRLDCERFSLEGTALAVDAGPHCTEPDGTMNIGALALCADMSLATAIRPRLVPGERLATTNLHMHFTGAPVTGKIVSHTHFEGWVDDALSMPQANCRGAVHAGGKVVCVITGAFARLPPPPGVSLSPLPWENGARIEKAPLAPRDMDGKERALLKRMESCLAASREGGSFIRHFWSQQPEPGPDTARSVMPIDLAVSNRVGHVQGGVLVGMAVANAMAAVPQAPVLTAVSAWYISAGEGRAIRAKSEVIQRGRNISVVRTQVLGPDRRRVLEVVTSHASRGDR